MTNTTMNNAAANNNQAAANKAQGVINANIEKFKSIIKNFPGIIAKNMDKIENIGSMSADEAQAAVTKFFNETAEHAQECADYLKESASNVNANAGLIKDYESFAETFKELGKEFSAASNVKEQVEKAAKIVGVFFLSMIKALVKGAKKAAMWIAVTGVRIICTAAGFIIKVLKAAVKHAKKAFSFGKAFCKARKEAKEAAEVPYTVEDLEEEDFEVEVKA